MDASAGEDNVVDVFGIIVYLEKKKPELRFYEIRALYFCGRWCLA